MRALDAGATDWLSKRAAQICVQIWALQIGSQMGLPQIGSWIGNPDLHPNGIPQIGSQMGHAILPHRCDTPDWLHFGAL